ncbi:ABC transporter permease [Bifidobacterium pseudolongum subsp. globosum]|uniref:ABC transporter permease n=1 Tax=Bifidobacterium pseudolongum subsp. globosum TaxID=1690 RepID=A0A4Q4ZYT9_9BIFI|nr:sugar ABC transporter permease [Bifidobacterium pseudolongum]RYQ08485.1 ABC transporter permease [Bifidobacterium pseudolongum subsp. globosum]
MTTVSSAQPQARSGRLSGLAYKATPYLYIAPFFLLPYIVAASTAGIIFSQIFSDRMDAANMLLQTLGMNPVAWRTNTLAAMQAVPNDVIEAAIVDGAGKARTFFSVVLPMLKPTLIFVIINSTIGGLQIFDEVQMFNNGTGAAGGPNNQYLTVSLYLYKLGFNQVSIGQPNLGRAAARSPRSSSA